MGKKGLRNQLKNSRPGPPAEPGAALDFSPRFTDPPADAIRASKRFFVSPSPTSSLVEEARMDAELCGGATATVTESWDPREDFRLSMKEMAEARRLQQRRRGLDWRFAEDLLFTYLQLNDRSVHLYILTAFRDVFMDDAEQFLQLSGAQS